MSKKEEQYRETAEKRFRQMFGDLLIPVTVIDGGIVSVFASEAERTKIMKVLDRRGFDESVK